MLFDPEDARDAQLEAWSPWARIDPLAAPAARLLREVTGAFEEHDRERFKAVYAEDLILEDHRHAGLGPLRGADAYVDSIAALWELAPDTRIEIPSVPAHDRHGFVATTRRVGTLSEGGEYEAYSVNLFFLERGRVTHYELFEAEDLDRALARFEELGSA